MYPDLTEFNPADLCPVPGFTIRGRQAFLHSAMNSDLADRNYLWMKDYGLDGVLIQRFVSGIAWRRSGDDVVLRSILQAARYHGRAIAIEYDATCASPENFFEPLRDDWKYLVTELKLHPIPATCIIAEILGPPVLSWSASLN